MLPFKIGFFTYYGTVGILTYLLPLYLKHIGFSPSQIGIVACSRSLGALVGGTVFSMWFFMLAKFKYLMRMICGLLLLFILPVGMVSPSPKDDCIKNMTSGLVDDLAFSDRSWMFRYDEVTLMFIAFSILVFCADVFALSYLTALQGGCMVQLGKENSKDYGKIRAWGAIAQSTEFLIIGAIVSSTVTRSKICGGWSVAADYHYMFYFIIWLSVVGIINSGYIPIEAPTHKESNSAASPMTQTLTSLKTFKNISWLVVQFCRSMFFSATHGFLTWHVENIGATPFLIGVLNGLATFSQFISFLVATKMIDVCGHALVIVADLVSQVGRFLAFALISNPDYILPLLAVEGLMFGGSWSATATYLSNQVPEGSQTEVQGVFQTVHTTGKAVGFLFSGYLTQALGAPAMFTIFTAVACGALILFISAHIVKTERRVL
ncbi:uncharacterized protein LOC135463436 [Liolophura sinensis]|uniref:uncharacterized protein LOC135463436 n=1 Tax=Liolophura sinensis TaxID=3198878 RepID=UPI003158CC4F